MSYELASAMVRIRGDVSALRGDMFGARDIITNALQGIQSYVGGMLGSLVTGYGISSLIGEANEAIAKAQRKMGAEQRMEATWIATKNAIGKTQEELKEMIEEWEKVTKFDGADITDAMASMLTYTSLTADQMTKVMETAMDISTVFGGSLRSNVEQIGRLLARPDKGLGMLSKKGYYVTPEQEQLMKELVKKGDMAGAQKIVFDVLSGQEGAAKRIALVGAELRHAQREVDNLKERIGKDLLPVMTAWQMTTLNLTKAKLQLVQTLGPLVGWLLAMNLQMDGLPIKFIGATLGIISLIVAIRGLITTMRRLSLTMYQFGVILAIAVAFARLSTATQQLADANRDLAASYDTLLSSMKKATVAGEDIFANYIKAGNVKAADDMLNRTGDQLRAANEQLSRWMQYQAQVDTARDNWNPLIRMAAESRIGTADENVKRIQEEIAELEKRRNAYMKIKQAGGKTSALPGEPYTAAPTLDQGRFKFQELGSKLQDKIFEEEGGGTAEKHYKATLDGNKIQTEILEELRGEGGGGPPLVDGGLG